MYHEPTLRLQSQEITHFLDVLPHGARLGVVVPCFNEEQVINSSLGALAAVVNPADIYVVCDGCTDRTAELARQHTEQVLELTANQGKAVALQALMTYFQLLERYDYLLFSDADSLLGAAFLEGVREAMVERPACIVGTVHSQRKGVVSAYRTYEYALTHRLFKNAQDRLGVITVAPGCVSLYRTDVLRELDFSGHTLTEDFDLTLQIHEKKLGKIVYAAAAQVITQDPLTLADYHRQVTRWYTGFWQNIWLHRAYRLGQPVFWELALLIGDGLSWIGVLVWALLKPALFLHLVVFGATLTAFLAIALLSVEREFWAIPYLPAFPIFQAINIISYATSFIRSIQTGGERLPWQRVGRYAS